MTVDARPNNSSPGGSAAGSEYRSAVLAATDIIDLIGKTVAIKRRGKNYLGLCPFHSEKSPSFNVDPGKQYFHCFGCKDFSRFAFRRRPGAFACERVVCDRPDIGIPPFARLYGGGSRAERKMQAVTIYTTAWCPYCSAAKSLLKEKGVTFQEIDVERAQGARATMVERAGGRTSVPQIFIGASHVGGCDDLYALDRSGKLDPLLKDTADA